MRNFPLFLLFILAFAFSVGQIGCSSKKDDSNHDVEVRKLFNIGVSDEDAAAGQDSVHRVSFAQIFDMACDRSNNLYALDPRYMDIKVFDSIGTELKEIVLPKGRGPGEFGSPKAITVSDDGCIFVADAALKRITRLDSTGRNIDQITVPFMPARLVSCGDKLFVSGFWISYDGPVVQEYTLDGKLIGSYIQRPSKWRLIALTGDADRLAVGPENTIFYSYPSPYQIFEFDQKGTTVRQSDPSELTSFNDPISENGAVMLTNGTRGLAVLPSGIVFNVVVSNQDWKIDVFSRELHWKSHIDSDEFGLTSLPLLTADHTGCVYIYAPKPLPHIQKYRVVLKAAI